MPRSTPAGCTLLLLALGFPGCGEGTTPDAAPSATLVEDSTGVSLVTSAPEGHPRWVVAREQEVAIGSLDGPEALFQIRDIERLGDGTWVVLNAGSSEIRLYDASGGRVGAFGREGEGPGEFVSLSSASVLPGDSIAAWDFRQRRITVFDPDGTVGRDVTLDVQGSVVGRLDGGRFALLGVSSFGGELRSNTLARPDAEMSLVEADGEPGPSLGSMAGSEAWFQSYDDGSVSIRTVRFAKGNAMAASGARIFAGVTEVPELRVWDQSGADVARWRLDVEPAPVSDEDWDAAREYDLERYDGAEAQRATLDFYAEVTRPGIRPVWSGLVVDDEGGVWVRRFRAEWEPGPERWWVFDDSGSVVREVETPVGLRVLWVGGDRIAGVVEDDLGVESIRIHRILPESSRN